MKASGAHELLYKIYQVTFIFPTSSFFCLQLILSGFRLPSWSSVNRYKFEAVPFVPRVFSFCIILALSVISTTSPLQHRQGLIVHLRSGSSLRDASTKVILMVSPS